MSDFLSDNYDENINLFKKKFEHCMDFLCKEFMIQKTKAALISIDGLINKQTAAQSILNPILNANIPLLSEKETYEYVKNHTLSAADQTETGMISTIIDKLMAGFAVLIMDKSVKALMFGIQGFATRSVSDPENEPAQRGSREGFVESYQINISLIRRRLRTVNFKSERIMIGKESNTGIAICYLDDVVSHELLAKVKSKLMNIKIQTVLASGYLSPFLSYGGIFSNVGYTERPDTVAGKIAEGRIAVIVDGTPNVLIVPYLFTEYFQSFDDYVTRPFFATFTRIIKIIAFLIAVLLPGMYIAIIMYHPQMLKTDMLIKITSETAKTPLTVFSGCILTMILYEIMREAGLRVQKVLGPAVGIVGGLVVGQAAVTAGIIASMTLMVIAISALSSYTVPKLYESIALVRFILILAAGISGLWGVFMTCAFLMIDTCAQNTFGIPFTTPISPFSLSSMRDTLIRAGWKKLSQSTNKIQNMPGAEGDKTK